MSPPIRRDQALFAATLATRRVIATSKNPRTVLGQMSPTGVAYHAALEAINVYRALMGEEMTPGLPGGPP